MRSIRRTFNFTEVEILDISNGSIKPIELKYLEGEFDSQEKLLKTVRKLFPDRNVAIGKVQHVCEDRILSGEDFLKYSKKVQ